MERLLDDPKTLALAACLLLDLHFTPVLAGLISPPPTSMYPPSPSPRRRSFRRRGPARLRLISARFAASMARSAAIPSVSSLPMSTGAVGKGPTS